MSRMTDDEMRLQRERELRDVNGRQEERDEAIMTEATPAEEEGVRLRSAKGACNCVRREGFA